MGLDFTYQWGQTPIDEEEKDGLLIKSITTQSELNEHEQLNIEKAIAWTLHSKFTIDQLLTEAFIKKLHKKMFSDVWRWAGKFRKSEKNLGVPWIQIATKLKYLLDDVHYWIKNETYAPDELILRFKHRLVSIHCFPNGNGRHARLMADIMIHSIFRKDVFSWHHSNMVKPDETRAKYINAIREADQGNIIPLIQFARN